MNEAVRSLRALLRHHDGVDPILVAVDGCGGAGKSSIARAVADDVGGVVVSLDHFYRPMDHQRRRGLDAQTGYELYYDWQRLIAEVLDPLVLGDPAIYRCYDPATDELGDQIGMIEPRGVIVFEGPYALRPQLRGYWDIAVFVETPAELRTARLAARGGDASWIERWTAAEEWYLANVEPQAKADLVVAGS